MKVQYAHSQLKLIKTNLKLEQSYSPHAFAQPVQVDFNTLSDCKKFAVDESTVCTFSVEIN